MRELNRIREALHYGRLVKITFDGDREFSCVVGGEDWTSFTKETFREILMGKLSAWKKRYPSLQYERDQIVSHFDLLFKYDYIASLFPEFTNAIMNDYIQRIVETIDLPPNIKEDLLNGGRLARAIGQTLEVIHLYRGDWRKTQQFETIVNTEVDNTFNVQIERVEDSIIGYFKNTTNKQIGFMIKIYEVAHDKKIKNDILIRLIYEYLKVDEYMHIPRSVFDLLEYDRSFRKKHNGEKIDAEILSYDGMRIVSKGKTKYPVEYTQVSIHALQAFFDVLMYLCYAEQKRIFIVASTDSLVEKSLADKIERVAVITHEKIREITGVTKDKASRILKAFEELSHTEIIFKRDENDRIIIHPIFEYARREIGNNVVTMYVLHPMLVANFKSYILALRNSFTKLSALKIPSRLKQLAQDILLYLNGRKNNGMSTLRVEEFAELYSPRLAQRREWTKFLESIEHILKAMKSVQIIADYIPLKDGFRVLFP